MWVCVCARVCVGVRVYSGADPGILEGGVRVLEKAGP